MEQVLKIPRSLEKAPETGLSLTDEPSEDTQVMTSYYRECKSEAELSGIHTVLQSMERKYRNTTSAVAAGRNLLTSGTQPESSLACRTYFCDGGEVGAFEDYAAYCISFGLKNVGRSMIGLDPIEFPIDHSVHYILYMVVRDFTYHHSDQDVNHGKYDFEAGEHFELLDQPEDRFLPDRRNLVEVARTCY